MVIVEGIVTRLCNGGRSDTGRGSRENRRGRAYVNFVCLLSLAYSGWLKLLKALFPKRVKVKGAEISDWFSIHLGVYRRIARQGNVSSFR